MNLLSKLKLLNIKYFQNTILTIRFRLTFLDHPVEIL